jgi:hypothetical protein
MKKAFLILFFAIGAYQVKAQQPTSIVPPSAFQPLIADSINFKSLYLTKSFHKKPVSTPAISAPNLQKQMDKARFDEMLAANTPKSNMPVARLKGRSKMPVYRAPNNIHYHMLISKPAQGDTTRVKLNP